MRPETRRGPGSTTPDLDQTASSDTGTPEDTAGVRQDRDGAEVAAARHLADMAKRLSLRANGRGHVDCDDLLDVVGATGRLVVTMMDGPR